MTQVFDPGTLVKNRNRLWRVEDQTDDVVTVTGLGGNSEETHNFFLPLEDLNRANIDPPDPTIVGEFPLQKLLIQSNRLSMLHGTAPLLSLQRSRVIPTAYQLVPVIMALEMPRVRLLLADDVGLGKTIEAGLIITELMARNRLDRVLFLTPANLREQWNQALDYFFHLDVPIISRRHRRMLDSELPPGSNHWSYFPRLISSISYAKQDHVKPQILQQDWDMVVVDEAHKLSKPHQSGPNQSVNKVAWDFAKEISEAVPNILLLTATPHNGYRDSFASLLHLVDPKNDFDLIDGPLHDPTINRKRAKQHVCQRRRRDVQKSVKTISEENPFPKRDQDEITIPVHDKEIKAIEQVERLGDFITRSAEETQQRSRVLARWTQMHFHKRALSSPAALRESLKNRLEVLSEAGHEDEPPEGSIELEVAKSNTMDKDLTDDLTEEEATFRMDRAVVSPEKVWEREYRYIEEGLKLAKKVKPKDDNKLKYLSQKLLPSWLKNSPPRVIVFTRYLDTLEYLAENLPTMTELDFELVKVYGELSEGQRRDRFEAFSQAEPAVMLTTDCMAEGVNLQQACAQLVHYELPWNPNRLEQRNGRIDRFGQKEETVRIRTLVMHDTLDATILNTLIKKASQIHEDYGFSPPYFSEETDVFDLMNEQGVSDQLEVDKQLRLPFYRTSVELSDPFEEETLEQIKSDSFYGQQDVDLSEVKERLDKTRKRIGTVDNLKEFVFVSLGHLGGEVIETEDGVYEIKLSSPSLDIPGIERSFTGTFEAEKGLGDTSLDVLDLGHPLVRRLIELMKERLFARGEKYGRTAYKVNEKFGKTSALVWTLVRFLVQTSPASVVEELLPIRVFPYSETDRARIDDNSAELPSKSNVDPDVVSDHLCYILEDYDELEAEITDIIESRRQDLIKERQDFLENITREVEKLPDWIKGTTDLSVASRDILALTMLYPR